MAKANPALARILGVKPTEPVVLQGEGGGSGGGGGGGGGSTVNPAVSLGSKSESFLTTPAGQALAKAIGFTPPTLTGREAWRSAQPAQSAASSPLQSILNAILAGSQGQVPQGYADFFSQVLPHLQAAQDQSFAKELGSVKGADPNMIANYEALNRAAELQQGPQAQGLQQFVLGPLANNQKMMQALQTALSFIPYSASGIGTTPTAASEILAALGIGSPGVGTLPATASGSPVPPSLAPSLGGT